MWGVFQLAPEPLPRPLTTLASREELNIWLTRVLFSALVPGIPQKGHHLIRYPINLATFVGLLIHLHSVGFPSHWLTEYLHQVLAGSLTSEVAIYRGQLSIPLSDNTWWVSRCKVCLDPWRVDFENILALSYEALAFPISLPDDFVKTFDEIGLFEVLVPRHKFTPRTAMNLVSPFNPVMALMFYKPGLYQPDNVAKRINKVLEGNIVKKPGELYIMTTVDEFNMWNGFIR